MKKSTLALALVALMPFASANAYEYHQSQSGYSSAPIVRTNTYKKASTSRRTGGYNNVITNNFYYGQPQAYADAPMASGNYYNASKKQTKTVQKSYTSQTRKYFLAHPFFQPLQGHFGSVTDLSYARNSFKFDILGGSVLGIDKNVPAEYNKILDIGVAAISGKAETSQFAVKEDISFGLTDTLALIGMVQYDKTKTKFKDWSGGEPGDSKSDSGFNLFGIGLQNRFVDNDEWIVMGEAYFQHQKDVANTLMGGVKAGYKINRTTVYGLARIAYTNLTDGDIYGAYVDDSTGDWLMLSYKTDVKDLFQIEGGLGAFMVLNKYFTLNGEMIYGHYDWHNQLNIKGAIGWQPGDMFALNLYASAALYDSAKGKTREFMNYDVNPDISSYGYSSSVVYTTGDYKIKDYNEWKIGIQGILYF